MVRILILILLLATQAQAGAWPREEGEGFLSLSFDSDAEDASNNFLSVYVEYGLSNGRTIGLDRLENGYDIDKTIAFVRWPFGKPGSAMKLAYEMGIGVVDRHAALRPGISVGRGFELGRRSGWLNLDARALIYDDLDNGLIETDFTIGLNANERNKVIFQLQVGAPKDRAAYAIIAPRIVLKQNAGRHFFFGVTAGVVEVDDLEVNLGLWQDF